MEPKNQKFHLDKFNGLCLFFFVVLLFRLTIFPYLGGLIIGLSFNIIIYIILFGLTLVFCRISDISISTFGFNRKDIAVQIFFGVAVAITLIIIFIGGFTIFGYQPQDYLSQAAPSIKILLLHLVFYFFIVGPIEEFMFRGYLLSLLTDISRSPAWGAVISSLLFGAWHWMSGNLLQVVSTFLIGLVFALSKQKFRNCTMLSIILAHSLYNVALELIRWFFC